MKNAMKKLTSLLLVAVLLVGAIPFSALAADEEVSFATGAEVAAANIAPAAETPAAETPAPVANEEGEISFSTSTPAAAAAVPSPVSLQVYVDYSDKADVNKTITVNEGTAVHLALAEVVDAAAIADIQANYTVEYKDENGAAASTVVAGMKQLKVICTRKAVTVAKYYLEIDVLGSEQGKQNIVKKHGDVLTLNEALLTANSISVPAGQKIDHFYVNGTKMNVGDTYTIVGGTKVEVVTIPNDGTSSGGTTGGTTGGNQGTTGGITGGNQNTSGIVVTFTDAYGAPAVYAYVDANGKILARDAELAALKVVAPSGYVFTGRWQIDGKGDSIATNTIVQHMSFTANTTFIPSFTKAKNDVVTSIKNQNDIILNIFVNKDFNNCKTVRLNDHRVIADDKITTYEILNYVVTDYYKASNGNLGLQCDGMYYAVGSFMYNWLLDNAAVKVDAIDGIAAKRANGVVTINVMVTNAVAKNATGNADKSNPKTGDDIYTAMTVMGLSAASLAAVMFFYNKKRYTV